MKKFLSIILTLCLLLGMAATTASAADVVSSSDDTVVLKLDPDETLNIDSSGYYINNGAVVPFTGKYILTGAAEYIVIRASCDVTFHDLKISTPRNSTNPGLWAWSGCTVNLTVKGINSITASWNDAIGYNINVNLTVADNSSITMKGASGYSYITSGSTLTMADGTDLPAVSADGSLTVLKGTPAAHTTYTALTGGKHKASCTACGIDYTTDCSNITGEYINKTSCKLSCADCGNALGTYDHYYEFASDGDANGHVFECAYCDGKKTEPHTYNDGWYHEIDSEHCCKECDYCTYVDENNPVAHDFSDYDFYNDTYCRVECVHCGYYDSDNPILQEHSYTKYVPYDDETHVAVCKYCDDENDDLSSPHDFDDGVAVAATREHGEGTLYTCKVCGYSYITPDPDKSIIFEVYDDCEDGWQGNAFVVYVDGVPTRVITNRELETEIYSMPYSSESSYVFKWVDGSDGDECALKIYFPGSDSPVCEYEVHEMNYFDTLDTIFSYNCADYDAVDEALEKIPNFLESYSAQSVEKLVTAVKVVKRMLPASKQADVDAMAAAVEKATNELVLLDTPVPNGFINLSNGYDVIINFDGTQGYKYVPDWEKGEYSTTYASYSYSGKYTFFETGHDDFDEPEYVDYGVLVYSGNVEIETVNVFISGDDATLSALGDSNVTLTPVGANAFDSSDAENAGIAVSEEAKLTINDSDGSILAVGDSGCAGIGGVEDEHGCGDIHIKGSTVFALSLTDGAGIGGGEDTTVGTITIDGGVIHAQCLRNDGSGIGQGEDGEDGDIIINGGDIVALCVDGDHDGDGAGIGGADAGNINSITINGGTIIAGSNDGAAIGGGDESDYGGKIIINGGNISASLFHNPDRNLVGNGKYDGNEGENNFVQINGGTINAAGTAGITPAPANKDGKKLAPLVVEIKDNFVGEDIIITLSDGTQIKASPDEESFTIYAPEDTTVSEIKLASDPSDGDDDDDMFWLWKFFRSIFEWFGSVFQAIGDFFKGLFVK